MSFYGKGCSGNSLSLTSFHWCKWLTLNCALLHMCNKLKCARIFLQKTLFQSTKLAKWFIQGQLEYKGTWNSGFVGFWVRGRSFNQVYLSNHCFIFIIHEMRVLGQCRHALSNGDRNFEIRVQEGVQISISFYGSAWIL